MQSDATESPEVLAKRARHTAYMREYTRRNADEINAQRRARRTPETLARERAWKAANHGKVLVYKRRDWAKNREDYRRRAKERYYATRNTPAAIERKRADYRLHRDEIAARLKASRLANPERHRETMNAAVHRRRALKLGVPSERITRKRLFERDGRVCGICHKRVRWPQASIDHIVPLFWGGHDTWSNVQLAHRRCNSSKGYRGPSQMRLTLD